METLLRSLNYDLQFDKDAQHILENSHNPASVYATNTIALSSTPTITTLDASNSNHLTNSAATTTTDFLQKLGASIINSIQLQSSPLNLPAGAPVSTTSDLSDNMDFLTPPHIVINTNSYDTTVDELQKQVEYDRFMNEVWIGIVLTLILISMVFCFCSCFLYHQFRVWKRNYRTTLTQNTEGDNVKISLDIEDPVPEYTLVSGLPSYEAALELLHKNPQSCLIVHPSVFEVFNRTTESSNPITPTSPDATEPQSSLEATTPLLGEASSVVKVPPQVFIATLPSYQEATETRLTITPMPYNHSFTSISMVNEKSQSKLADAAEKSSVTLDNNEKPQKS